VKRAASPFVVFVVESANNWTCPVLRPSFYARFTPRIKQLLIQSRSRLLERLTIRQRPGVMTFRYWQEGPGYDRNLIRRSTILADIDYLHHNPVRRGLVPKAVDWKWSSARFYLLDPPQQYSGLPIVHSLPAEFLDGNA
jgi:putative transposase